MGKIVISAAHTSANPGAVFGDLREFDLTRKLLQMVSNHLKNLKVDYIQVPIDLTLLDRIKWINNTGLTEEKGDVFLELHVNDGGERGVESWFRGKEGDDNNSEKFAKHVQDELCKATGFQNQGAKSEFSHELGSLLILNQTKQISAAIELLYIDNPDDIKILKDDKQLEDLTKKLAEVIKKFLDNPPKLTPKNTAIVDENLFPKANSPIGGFGGDFDDDFDPFGGLPDNNIAGGINTSNSGSSSIMMDKEQRKQMILETYKKMLGKEPKPADLNQYLQTGISEDQLMQRIVKSKDFEEMVKEAAEAAEVKSKFKEMESENIKNKSQVNDLQAMLNNLNILLQQKNNQILLMQQELVRKGIIKNGEYYDPSRVSR